MYRPVRNLPEPVGLAPAERLTLDLAPGLYRYKFLIDSEWHEDPANERKEQNEFGGYNSVIEVN